MNYQRGVDIIVVGYHQPDDAQEFHEYLMRSSDQTPWDVWYVSVEASSRDRRIGEQLWGEHHLAVEYNCGHATACNLAAPMGIHDTMFFCNADTRLPKGVIDRLYSTLWSDDRYGAVGPRQIDETGRITAAGIFGTHRHPKHRGWLERSRRNYQDVRDDVIVVSGSLFMIKRHVWLEIEACPRYVEEEIRLMGCVSGAMPAVKHYYSETWPCYHLAAHGYKNVYDGQATARHDWHKASPQGGWGEINLPADRDHFRKLCDAHGIDHD